MTATTTAPIPHAGFAPGEVAQGLTMLTSVTEIQAFLMREQPGMNKRFAERAARKLQKMRTIPDFYEGLRVLGIHTDSTARDAVRNIERTA